MIVSPGQTGEVSVDFNKRCDIERAAQATFAGRQTGLEEVNLLEVEVDMLVVRRKQLAKDELPAAGFRVYDAVEEDGLAAKSTIEEEYELEEHVNTFEEDTIEILNAVADEEEIVDGIEQELFEEQNAEDQAEEHVNTFEENIIEILNAVADEEEIVDEIEKEAFEEQNDVDDESEKSKEE
jgi:hypothetical protein